MNPKLRDWAHVGTTDHGPIESLLATGQKNYTSLLMAPAILRLRTTRRNTKVTSVRIFWQTSDESFPVSYDGEMAFQDGDRITVLISTRTSSTGGYANGFANIEAIEIGPGAWAKNKLSA